jgi:hypothetical protein
VAPSQPDGDNGWYRGRVDVSWAVDGPSITGESGCEPVTIDADTTGTTLTCTATNEAGTASDSVTIKRDATPPTIPDDGAPYTGGHLGDPDGHRDLCVHRHDVGCGLLPE